MPGWMDRSNCAYIWGKWLSEKRKSMCKGPEQEVSWTCSKNEEIPVWWQQSRKDRVRNWDCRKGQTKYGLVDHLEDFKFSSKWWEAFECFTEGCNMIQFTFSKSQLDPWVENKLQATSESRQNSSSDSVGKRVCQAPQSCFGRKQETNKWYDYSQLKAESNHVTWHGNSSEKPWDAWSSLYYHLYFSRIGFHVKTSTKQLLRMANAQEHCKCRGYTLQEWEAPTLTKSLHQCSLWKKKSITRWDYRKILSCPFPSPLRLSRYWPSWPVE